MSDKKKVGSDEGIRPLLRRIAEIIIAALLGLLLSILFTIGVYWVEREIRAIPTAQADEIDSSEYSQPSEDIARETRDGMSSLTSDDISSLDAVTSWLGRKETYIWTKSTDGVVSRYLNTPNLQKNAENMVQRLQPGGWVVRASNPINSGAHTAEGRYGWGLPSATYVGETPVVQIDIQAVIRDTISPWNTAKVAVNGAIAQYANNYLNIVNAITGGDLHVSTKIIDFNPSYIRSVWYANTDYNDSGRSYYDALAGIIERDWDRWSQDRESLGDISINGKSIFDDGVVLSDSDTNRSGSHILDALIDKSGASFTQIVQALLDYSRDSYGESVPSEIVTRDMPYDLQSMAQSSRDYMGGVSDPRVDMTHGGDLLGIPNSALRQIGSSFCIDVVLGVVSLLCRISSMMNGVCDLKMLESNGIDFTVGWTGVIGQLLIYGLAIGALVGVVMAFFKMITGSGASGAVLSKAISSVIVAGVAIAILGNPWGVKNLLVDTSSKLMSIGAVALDNNEDFSCLYDSQASAPDKSSLRYWYLYYNIWASYITNHPTNEDSNIIDTNSGGNEYRDISVPSFQDGTRLDRWSCILAESLSSGSDIRPAYRVTDHYMAPVVQGGEQFTVSPNPRYNGEMFSQFPVGGILIALAVAVLSFIKLLCFIELCVDIMLLFVNLALGSAQSIASGRSQVMDVAKRLGSDILRVMIYDIFVTLLIYASSVTNNGGQAALGVLSAAAVVGLYRMISKSHSAGILTPGLFTVFEAAHNRAKSVIHGIEEENAEAENNKREIERDLATIKRMKVDNKASYSGTRATVDMSEDSGVSEDNNAEDGSVVESHVESDDDTIVDAGADNKRD